jgi:Tfp pilus assembly protein FimT
MDDQLMEEHMNEHGAGLVELMIVMTLASVALVFAGEGFVAAASKQQRKAVTTELVAELRSARHVAMMRRERIRVVLQPATSELRMESADSLTLIRRYDFHDRRVVVESVSNGPSVMFYPNGRAASPTTVTLRNARQEHWQITVSLTGKVSLL